MDVPLPPAALRQGGRHFASDEDFLQSAVDEATKLKEVAGLTETSRVVDFGCGPGRLAIGLITDGYQGSYTGIEVQQRHVDWCLEHITSTHPNIKFRTVTDHNARYNPGGSAQEKHIPIHSNTVDVFYAYSVFSHMDGYDTEAYLREISRVLQPDGRAFITMFVESGVPDETENPDWYGPLTWTEPLHCVLYSMDRAEKMIYGSGLSYVHFFYGSEVDGQTGLVLKKSRPA